VVGEEDPREPTPTQASINQRVGGDHLSGLSSIGLRKYEPVISVSVPYFWRQLASFINARILFPRLRLRNYAHAKYRKYPSNQDIWAWWKRWTTTYTSSILNKQNLSQALAAAPRRYKHTHSQPNLYYMCLLVFFYKQLVQRTFES